MDVETLKLLLAFAIYGATFLCCVLPLKLVPPRRHDEAATRMPEQPQRCGFSPSWRTLSLMNCLSAGVFLATCFLGLMPFVREKFTSVLESTSMDSHLPLTELCVLAGFFLILFIEQYVTKIRDQRNREMEKAMVASSTDAHSNSMDNNMEKLKMTIEKDSSTCLQESEGNSKSTANGKKFSRATSSTVISEIDETARLTKHGEKCAHHGKHRHSHHASHHGHSHLGDLVGESRNLRFFVLVLALSIHSVFEGMALGLQVSVTNLINLFVALLIHECLVALALGISLTQLNLKQFTYVKFCLVYCCLIPLGIAVGFGVRHIQGAVGDTVSAVLQGVAAGTFLHVTFLELIPAEINSGRDRLVKVGCLALGAALVTVLIISTSSLHH